MRKKWINLRKDWNILEKGSVFIHSNNYDLICRLYYFAVNLNLFIFSVSYIPSISPHFSIIFLPSCCLYDYRLFFSIPILFRILLLALFVSYTLSISSYPNDFLISLFTNKGATIFDSKLTGHLSMETRMKVVQRNLFSTLQKALGCMKGRPTTVPQHHCQLLCNGNLQLYRW